VRSSRVTPLVSVIRQPSALAITSGKNRTFITDARYLASSSMIFALSTLCSSIGAALLRPL
jgi:hypothetical protein